MNVFEFRNRLVKDYAAYIRSFIKINDQTIESKVKQELDDGLLWPEPLIQLNPLFESGETIEQLINQGILHKECERIFRTKKDDNIGKKIQLYQHQSESIKLANKGHNFVLTTGTGSGKSLAYIIPIVNYILNNGSGNGIKAIIVYPMNALANSQFGELEKFICLGYDADKQPVKFERYTGQESDAKKQEIIKNPPDILLTNYVMLELILTRPHEINLIQSAKGLQFFVLDELHTYRGRQGADVSLLVRRVKNRLQADKLQYIGTSATLAGGGSYKEQCENVARVASKIFGATVLPEHVIGETLKRVTQACDFNDPTFINQLTKRVSDPSILPSTDYINFINDPLSIWIESTFGITKDKTSHRLVRCKPQSILGQNGVAQKLSQLTSVSVHSCAEVIKNGLLGGYLCEPHPETGFNVFAFRVNQFISRGDTVYASVESEEKRYLTVHGQQFVPGYRNRILFPLAFCRECGQEYYCVVKSNASSNRPVFLPRGLMDRDFDSNQEIGFLYMSSKYPWTDDRGDMLDKIPDDWIEEFNNNRRIKRNYISKLPVNFHLTPDGQTGSNGCNCYFISSPFWEWGMGSDQGNMFK